MFFVTSKDVIDVFHPVWIGILHHCYKYNMLNGLELIICCGEQIVSTNHSLEAAQKEQSQGKVLAAHF